MKSVIRSAKPYWIYLILTGKKKVEVGKNFPKSKDWNKVVEMYCSKDIRSFNRIPEKDREWMRKYLGKIACRFVCDRIDTYHYGNMDYPIPAFDGDDSICEIGDGYYITSGELEKTCLTYEELEKYGKGAPLYGWHISDLVIYDKPHAISEFARPCDGCDKLGTSRCTEEISPCRATILKRPPQSWQFVQSIMGGRLHFEEV